MGVTIRSTVKKAAKLAVYEEMRINVKNHQTAPTILPDIDLKTQRPKVKTCEDDVYLLTQKKGNDNNNNNNNRNQPPIEVLAIERPRYVNDCAVL